MTSERKMRTVKRLTPTEVEFADLADGDLFTLDAEGDPWEDGQDIYMAVGEPFKADDVPGVQAVMVGRVSMERESKPVTKVEVVVRQTFEDGESHESAWDMDPRNFAFSDSRKVTNDGEVLQVEPRSRRLAIAGNVL